MDLNDAEAGGIAPGSDFHFASFYLPAAARTATRALEGWREVITAIPATCSDRGVAHLKLAWWQDEIARLAAGGARHPLAAALAPVVATRPTLLPALTRYPDAVATTLVEQVPATRTAALALVRALHGELFSHLLALAGSSGEPTAARPLLDLACLVEAAYELRNLRQHRRAGQLLLPTADLARHGLGTEDVRQARDSRALAPCLADIYGWLIAALDAALAGLPRAERRRQHMLCTQARLVRAALVLTRADGCLVLERRVELLPVHKLWLAWRTCYWG